MISDILKEHGIPENYSEIEVGYHPQFPGIPMLWFRSKGNPLVCLDLGGASQIRNKTRAAGEIEYSNWIDSLIKKAQHH